MSAQRSCPRCGRPAPVDDPQGVCRGCAGPVSFETERTLRVDGDPATVVVMPPSEGAVEPAPSPVRDFLRRTHGLTVDVALTQTLPVASAPSAEAPAGGAAGRLGRFTVIGFLGSGGMGDVLRVRDEDIGREVAAKICHRKERVSLEKFLLEAQVTGQLEHPSIVPVHELGVSVDGQVFFTMKRVEGRTLSDLFKEGSLPLVEFLEAFLKVLDAVRFAHSRGVLHRDLKPSNVMVGCFGEVQVVDWGLAKVLSTPSPPVEVDPASAAERLLARGAAFETLEGTLDGQVLGTPSYMPPEQAHGRIDQIDARSDVFALGAILYHYLAGEPPYSGASWVDALDRARRVDVVPPSARAPGRPIPRELEAAALKAMARLKRDRYAGVAEMREDLVRFLEGRTLAAARYNPVQVLAKWARRRRRDLAIAGLGLALAGAGAAWAFDRAREAREFELQADRASVALDAGRWTDALAAAEGGLALRDDPALESVARECAERIRELELENERRRFAEAELRPLLARIERARPLFEIAHVDIGRFLREVAADLDRIEALAAADQRLADDPAVRAALGKGRFFVGERRRAERELEMARRLGSRDPELPWLVGRLLLEDAFLAEIWPAEAPLDVEESRSLERAREALAAAGSGEGAAWHLVAICRALAAGDRRAVLALCQVGREREDLLKGRLEMADLWLLEAMAAGGEAAAVACTHALELRPHFAWARLLRGVLLWRDEEYSRAAADFEAAVAVDPHLALAWAGWGAAVRKAQGAEEAIAIYDRGIEANPDEAVLHLYRGNASWDRGDARGAERSFARALELAPGFALARAHHGAVLLARRPEEARDELERALELAPDSWRVWRFYAEAFRRAGKLSELETRLERAPPDLQPELRALVERWKKE